MLREIKARIGAARLLLEEHRGLPTHVQLSKIQSVALVETINKAALTSDDMAAVSTAALRVPWAEHDLTHVLGALTSETRSLPAGKRRRLQQAWTSVHNYFTEAQWCKLMSPDHSSTAKLDLILQHSIVLGLRLPTEPTSKWITCLWMLTGEAENVPKYDSNHKRSLFVYVKDRLHALT